MTIKEFFDWVSKNKIDVNYKIWINQNSELKEYNLSVDDLNKTVDIDEQK